MYQEHLMPLRLRQMLKDETKTSKSGSALFRLLIGKLIEDADSMLEELGSLIDACYGIFCQFSIQNLKKKISNQDFIRTFRSEFVTKNVRKTLKEMHHEA